MRIILDTNKWYDIAEGLYPYEKIKELPLCLTALNIIELIASPKLLIPEEKEKVLRTCRTILKLNPDGITPMPYDYIASEVLEIKNTVNHLGIERIGSFILGEYSEAEIKNDVDIKRYALQWFKESMNDQRIAKGKVNSGYDAPEIKAKMLSMIYMKTIYETKELLNISDTLLETIENTVDLNKNAKKIWFYLKGREANNNQLNAGKIEAKKNDQIDLLNMVYVGMNDKYWTRDEAWLERVHWNGIENFLFKFPSQEN
jgi:hypothetical protein